MMERQDTWRCRPQALGLGCLTQMPILVYVSCETPITYSDLFPHHEVLTPNSGMIYCLPCWWATNTIKWGNLIVFACKVSFIGSCDWPLDLQLVGLFLQVWNFWKWSLTLGSRSLRLGLKFYSSATLSVHFQALVYRCSITSYLLLLPPCFLVWCSVFSRNISQNKPFFI